MTYYLNDVQQLQLKLKDLYPYNAIHFITLDPLIEKKELHNCYNFFNQEIDLLINCKIIIALGKIAFDACVNFYKINFGISTKFIFKHGKNYKLPDGKILFGCYHPSPRNVNTKRINLKKMTSFFLKAKKFI